MIIKTTSGKLHTIGCKNVPAFIEKSKKAGEVVYSNGIKDVKIPMDWVEGIYENEAEMKKAADAKVAAEKKADKAKGDDK